MRRVLASIALVGVAMSIGLRVSAATSLEDPPGCFEVATPQLIISVFRADGVTGVVGSISECEHVKYRVTVFNSGVPTECAFGGGMLSLTTPDGAVHPLVDPVPCVGGTGANGSGCDPSVTNVVTALIEYAVRPEDVVGGSVVASATYQGWIIHSIAGPVEGPPVTIFVPKPVVFCQDGDPCTSDLCDPAGFSAGACSNPINPAGCFLCGDGAVQAGETCDAGSLNGRAGSCCSFDCKDVTSQGTVCRSSRGACDAAEVCDGSAGACPADAKVADGTVCREASGPCDLPETCDGIADECPVIDVLAAKTVCREATDACDVAEQCDGLSPSCPPDGKAAAGASCEGGDSCDGAGTCVDTCGDGQVEAWEACDLPVAPVGEWCTTSCRTVACDWQSVADALPAVVDGRALACSLAGEVGGAECAATSRAAKKASALRGMATRRLQALRKSGCRNPKAVARTLRGMARQLGRASRGLPFDECARNVAGPAFITWGRLLDDLRANPSRVCEGQLP